MTDVDGRVVVAVIGAVVGVLFYVAMTAASWFGQPLGILLAAAVGAAVFWGIDRATEDDT